MGQPVTVIHKPSSRAGVERYEINRSITGMGHERYGVDDDIIGDRPSDELARRLFARGGIAGVHVNSNVITLSMERPDTDGIDALIEELFTYYVPGVEIPSDEELSTPEAIANQ